MSAIPRPFTLIGPGTSVAGPTSGGSTDHALVRWDGATGRLVQNSVLICDDTTGALSGFGTGTGITLHGGGTVTGASGAVTVAASGTNQNITLTPSGSGLIDVAGVASNPAKLRIFGAGDANEYGFLDFRSDEATDKVWRWTHQKPAGVVNYLSLYYSSDGGTNYSQVLSATPARNLLIGTTDSTGLTGAGGLKVAATTAASASTNGSVIIGNLTAATTVGIGGGNIYAGTTIQAGGKLAVYAAAAGELLHLEDGARAFTVTSSGANSWTLAAGASNSLVLQSGGATALTLSSTQAATFADSVNISKTGRAQNYWTSTVSVNTGQSTDLYLQRSRAGTTELVSGDTIGSVNFDAYANGAYRTVGNMQYELANVSGTGATYAADGTMSFRVRSISAGAVVDSTGLSLTQTAAGVKSATFAGAIIESVDTRSGAGAVSITATTTQLTTTGADALTLANGTHGQIKRIVMVADGGDGTLTPTTKTGFSTITFDAVGDSVTLQYFTTLGWMILSNYNCTIG